jgi:CRP-like cAMP-binding protein
MTPQQVSDWATRLLLGNPFPGKSQREMVEIIQACRLQHFRDGQTILQEGQAGDELYFLMEGLVSVLKKDTNGEDRQLVVMEAPTMFGHMSMVDGSPRSATCRAKGVVTVASMNRELYQELSSRPHPIGTNLRRLMLATLTRQLVDGNARLFNLIGGEVPVVSTNAHQKAPAEPGAAAPRAKRPPSGASSKTVSRNDLLEMAGILNGWKVDTTGLEDIEYVETEADRLRSGKRSD